MSPMALIDYGLIVVFFVALAGLILVIARPHSAREAPPQAAPQAISRPQSQETRLAYGILTLLFALLIIGTFLTEREHAGTS